MSTNLKNKMTDKLDQILALVQNLEQQIKTNHDKLKAELAGIKEFMSQQITDTCKTHITTVMAELTIINGGLALIHDEVIDVYDKMSDTKELSMGTFDKVKELSNNLEPLQNILVKPKKIEPDDYISD